VVNYGIRKKIIKIVGSAKARNRYFLTKAIVHQVGGVSNAPACRPFLGNCGGLDTVIPRNWSRLCVSAWSRYRPPAHRVGLLPGTRLSSGLKTGLLIGKGAAMKKLLLATTALIALAGGSAVAADMTPAYKTPPPPLPAYSWTGCYVGAGGGYGIWNQENTTFIDGPPRTLNGVTQISGGRGWFGTAQVGCDYQFGSTWVVGAFADYDFGSIKGIYNTPNQPMQGGEKESSAWAVG